MGKLHDRLNKVNKGLGTFHWSYDHTSVQSWKKITFLGRMDMTLDFWLHGWGFYVLIMGLEKKFFNPIFEEMSPMYLKKVGHLLVGEHCKRDLVVETYQQYQVRKKKEDESK